MDAKNLEKRLEKRLNKTTNYLRQRQKHNYDLAKSLGFSAKEAAVLQNWKESDIRELAHSRGYTKEV